MDPLALTSALALYFFVDSGIRALRLNPGSAPNRVVFAVNLALAAGAIDSMAWPFIRDSSLVVPWNCVANLGWCLFFGLALHFCVLIAEPKRKLGLLLRLAIYAPGLALALALDAVLVSPEVRAAIDRPLAGGFGPVRVLFVLYYCTYIVAGTAILARVRSRSRLAADRRRTGVLILAMVVPFAGGMTTDFLLPAMGVPCPDVVVLWAVLWASGVRLAIQKYGFIAPYRTLGDAGRLFTAFLENSRDGIVLADEESRVAAWSKSMTQMTGLDADEALGRPIWEVQEGFRDPSAPSRTYRDDAKSLVSGLAPDNPGDWLNRVNEYPILRKDGERRWVQSAAFIIDLGGKRRATAAILRDVTAEKRAEATALEERRRLEMAEKIEAVGTLAAGLAHDFNNILTGVKGTVSLMRLGDGAGGPLPDAELESGLSLIENSSARGGELVRQLLALARKTGGERRPVALSQAIDHAIMLTRNSIDPSVSIVAPAPEAGATVMAEDAQVERILINLIINAADSMTNMRQSGEPQGGDVILSVSRDGGFWLISVRDSGIGISPEDLSRVFDPFYTTKSGGRSHGLGLPTVYAIVESHGGRMEALSEEGKGSEFRVWLPAS